MAEAIKKPEELGRVQFQPSRKGWMDPHVDFRRGTWNYAAVAETLRYLDQPNPRKWSPVDDDWKLPEDWQRIVLEGMAERLKKYRSFKLFMDI